MIRRRWSILRDQRGIVSIGEVLLASTLMLVVIGAAAKPFQMFETVGRTADNQNDSLANARNAVDNVEHQLRNVQGQTQLIDRAGSYDIVFQTVDQVPRPSGSQNSENIMRVRYCLDTQGTGASASNAFLWEQDLRWTTALVPTTMPGATCPDTSFGTSRRVMSTFVTNKISGQDRPIFSYYPAASPLAAITAVRIDLFADQMVNESPRETRMTSGVVLRNQNSAPTAVPTWAATGSPKQVTLDGSGSSDPEGLPLTYRWCDLSANSSCSDATKIGSGQMYTHTFTVASGTVRNMQLQVFDAGGLETDYSFQVTVP